MPVNGLRIVLYFLLYNMANNNSTKIRPQHHLYLHRHKNQGGRGAVTPLDFWFN